MKFLSGDWRTGSASRGQYLNGSEHIQQAMNLFVTIGHPTLKTVRMTGVVHKDQSHGLFYSACTSSPSVISEAETLLAPTATLMTPSSIFSVTPPGDIKVDKLAKCFAYIKLSTVEPGQSCNTIFCRQRPTGYTSHSLQFSVTQHYRSGPKRSRYARLGSN